MRAKWRSSLSACSSALEKCLTPPTLSERRCFNSYAFVKFFHGKNKAASDPGITLADRLRYDVPRIIFMVRVGKRPRGFSYCNDCEEKDEKGQNERLTQAALLHDPRQVNPTKSLALWPPDYRMRGLLQNQEDAASQEKTVQGTQASNLAVTLVVRLPNERLPSVL